MSSDALSSIMATSRNEKEVKVDKVSLAMYTRRVIERKEFEDIATEYGVSSRTVQRKVAAVIEAVKELAELKAAATQQPIPPEGNMVEAPGTQPHETPAPKTPKPPVVPGRLSRDVISAQREGAGGANEMAVAVRETYAQEITMPTSNPLSGIQDMMAISKVGVSAGVIAGSGFVKMRDAITRTDIPLGERALMMTQGSTVVSNMLLGLVEAARMFDEGAVRDNNQEQRR